MSKKSVLFVALILSVPGYGYELATHARLTNAAYLRSVLTLDETFMFGLGIQAHGDVFGEDYFDIYRGDIYTRSKNDFEETSKRMPAGINPLSITGWLMRGAIREDDHIGRRAPNPQDDPYNNNDLILDNRPLHHFYDPRNDRGLQVGLRIGQKAPDWAVGATNVFVDSNHANEWRRNHFTVFDAREAMFRALTGMDRNGSPAIGAGGSTPVTAEDKLAVRKAYWATTFRALGDLVHMVQDMAQPQHTRNDPHAGSDDYSQQAGPAGHKSFYEIYIDQRAKQSEITEANGHSYMPDSLVYDTNPSYPIPQFNSYVEYFSTQHLQSNVMVRKGMADYSNRGFFSVGKNLWQQEYDQPPTSISGGFYSPDPREVGNDGTKVAILSGEVHDAYLGVAEQNVPLTAFGAWNDAIQQKTGMDAPILIRENYDAMADLLVPRAVAYSAGLIDHFFRGRMEITLPEDGVFSVLDHAVENGLEDGFRKIKLRLRNTTPTINDGQNSYPHHMTGGALLAVAKFHRNGCYQPDFLGEPGVADCNYMATYGAEEISVSQPIEIPYLDVDQAQEFVFDFSTTPIPVNATSVVLQVVYRGELGPESDAVVVASREISAPTTFLFMNSTDYFMLDGVFYRPNEILNDPVLFQRIDLNGNGIYDPEAEVNADINIDPEVTVYTFNFGSQEVGNAELPPASFLRFSVLSDLPTIRINVRAQEHGSAIWSVFDRDMEIRKYDPSIQDFIWTAYTTVRGASAFHRVSRYRKTGSSGTEQDASVLDDIENTAPVEIILNF
ncbi:MAG: hypothetical protein OQL11_00085 [Gammaproteobacteria bacterium]|nr:hypothetical protein [Gammaproteobacteria bacterium]